MAATVVDATGTPTYSRSDANGNTAAINAAGSLTTYSWDIEDHITLVQLPAGSRNTFSYDGDGKRRRMEESASARDLLWDGENILREQDGATLVAQYTHAPERGVHPERSEWGHLVSQRRSGATAFHHFDALGSTRALTNAAQTATDTADYKAFGLANASSGSTTNPFRWVGRLDYYHQPDSSDYWLRARTFRPTMGRFISRDPIRQMNLYAFPSNSPVMMVDPSGRQGCASGARNGGSSSTDELISIGGPPATFRPQYQC